jgi:hypothetical protein
MFDGFFNGINAPVFIPTRHEPSHQKGSSVKNTVDITQENGNVIVRDNKTVFFCKPKSEQTVAIANEIYFAEKYANGTISHPLSGSIEQQLRPDSGE